MSLQSIYNRFIRVTVQSFSGLARDEKEEIANHVINDSQDYPIDETFKREIEAKELEVQLVNLLRKAAVGGFVVTIDNVSDPALGMGGYNPHVLIRPDHYKVRAEMDELVRHKANAPKE